MEEQKQKFDWQRLLLTIAIVLTTAGLVGGMVYYYAGQNCKIASDRPSGLVLKENDRTGVVKVDTEKTLTDLAPNSIEYATAKVSQKYGAMTLLSIGSVLPQAVSADNFELVFSGRVTVKANYTYTDPTQPSFGGENIYFSIKDPASLAKMPILKSLNNQAGFAIYDTSELKRVKSLLNIGSKGTSGTVAIVIDGYTLPYAPTEAFSSATVIDIVK